MAVEVLNSSTYLLSYAQFATDLAHRFAGLGSPTSVSAKCAYTGQITLQFNDRDGNGRASAGDAVVAVLDNCGVPALARKATGTLRVDIVSVSPSADVGLQAQLTVVDALQVTALGGGPNIGPIQIGTLRGSLGVRWTESASGSELRVVSSAADDLRFTGTYSGVESTNSLKQIDVSRTVQYDRATISTSMAFLFDLGTRGGMLRVKSPQPLLGDLNVLPRQMQVELEGAGGQILSVERDPPGSVVPLVATHFLSSTDANAVISHLPWGEFVALMKDIRTSNPVYSVSDQGSGAALLAPWRNAALMRDVDRACQQTVNAGVSNFRADALFQRPVAAEPGLAEAGAVLRVQFGRAIADNAPTLQFRMADAAEVIISSAPTWNVAATATRQGASYEIHLGEPLRHGRTYYLQSSYDGIDWSGDRIIRDAQSQIVNQGGSGFGTVYTDYVVVANTTYSNLATVAANVPAILRAGVDLRDGQAVSSYRWEQISGVPLHIASPQSAETDAVLDASNPQPVGDAVMQVTVTDSLGNSDRARVVMKAGTYLPQGAAFYTETGSSATPAFRREMSTGAGSIVYGSAPGNVAPRVPGPAEGGSGVGFTVTPANGQRLALGTYPNAIKSDSPGVQNGLISRVFCNTVDSPVTGSFQVLDIAYASDGTITRLAVDFVQRCEAGLAEYQKGSYRFNSAIALTP